MDERRDGPVALSRSITTSLGLPVVAWPIGGVLLPGMWDTDRPDCRNRFRLSDENRLFGLRACCTKAKMSFNRLLLRFPETRPASLPIVRRSPELPVDRILAKGTRPLNEFRNPEPPALLLLLLFDMVPSVELVDACRSTVIASWWTVAVTVDSTGMDEAIVEEPFRAETELSITVTVTAGMLLVVLLESSSVANGGFP